MGHEAVGIVESIGEGVNHLKIGDIVIPCKTPQCNLPHCYACSNSKTNLCPENQET